jgi:D-alanyl-lipoteichoic acid acyltransferase DltB (MBOAT superfamily)
MSLYFLLQSWLLTFHFFSFSLVIFRALNWQDAVKVYRGMLGLDGGQAPVSIAKIYGSDITWLLQLLASPSEFIYFQF